MMRMRGVLRTLQLVVVKLMDDVQDDAPKVLDEFCDAPRSSGCAAARQRRSKLMGVDELFGGESDAIVELDDVLLDEVKLSTTFDDDPMRIGRSRAI